MNKNKIIEFETEKHKGLFISVPYTTQAEECFFKNKESLRFALMCAYGRSELNFIPIAIPKGDYEIIGLSNQLEPKLVESKIEIPFKDYIKILNEKDVTVNYSDTSNFWLVVLKMQDFKLKAIEIKDKMGGFTEDDQILNAITTVDYIQENYLGKNTQVEFWDNVKKYLVELKDII